MGNTGESALYRIESTFSTPWGYTKKYAVTMRAMIRPLNHDDVSSYRTLRLRSLESDPGSFHIKLADAKEWSLERFEKECCGEDGPVFGYLGFFDGTSLLGYISLSRHMPFKDPEGACIYNLYVLPEHRKRGIARELIEAVLKRAQSEPHLQMIYLFVHKVNTVARTLYEKYGFLEDRGEHFYYYQLPSDEVLLSRKSRIDIDHKTL